VKDTLVRLNITEQEKIHLHSNLFKVNLLSKNRLMTTSAIREKLYDFIRVADDKKVKAIYMMLEDEIVEETEWWKDKQFIKELDQRHQDLESGKDKGFTIADLETTIDALRKKRYGK